MSERGPNRREADSDGNASLVRAEERRTVNICVGPDAIPRHT